MSDKIFETTTDTKQALLEVAQETARFQLLAYRDRALIEQVRVGEPDAGNRPVRCHGGLYDAKRAY